MIYDNLAGNWIYRSFVNLAEVLPELDPKNVIVQDVEKWSRYMFGQGTMVLNPSATGGMAGVFHMGDDIQPLDMTLMGRIDVEGDKTRVRWNAAGLPGTPSDGWLYEYDAHLVSEWPTGNKQVEAFVGSVIRSQPHNDLAPNQRIDQAARAGRVASFLMVRVPFKEPREAIPLPSEMLSMVGSRHHRLHHAIWHGLRDYWVTPGDGEITDDERREIAALGWAPPRANQRPTRGDASGREADNGAGEDFLYMHRLMLLEVRALLNGKGLPPIASWSSIPQPNRDSRNADGFSVPPAWDLAQGEAANKGAALIKSDEYWRSRMTFLERQFKSPEYLATLTLDQLGSKIEWLIHNLMHIRWCSRPVDPEDHQTLLPRGRPLTDTSDKWVQTRLEGKPFYYDDLNDTFSSHVHPVFWRLHGWVDDRIDDWFAAHNAKHSGQVVKDDVMGVPWFKTGAWVSAADPWVGPMAMMHHGAAGDGQAEIAVMQRVYDLIFKPDAPGPTIGRDTKFTQKVLLGG